MHPMAHVSQLFALCALSSTPPLPVQQLPVATAAAQQTVQAWLTFNAEDGAALVDPNARAATSTVAVTQLPSQCAKEEARDPASAVVKVLAGSPPLAVVTFKAGNGRGAHRQLVGVSGDGRLVLDVAVLVDQAEQELWDGDPARAAELASRALAVDAGNPDAMAITARAAARLGDGARAAQLVAQSKARDPDGLAWRVAALDVATVQGKPPLEQEQLASECMTATRALQWDDGRCFLLHAVASRGGKNQQALRQELEEALGRAPANAALQVELGLVLAAQARTGRTVDAPLLMSAVRRLQDNLPCAQALPSGDRAAAFQVLASSSLENSGGPCAAPAEQAVLLDPTVAEYRRTLLSCAEAAVLRANLVNRAALKDGMVDLAVEGQAISNALIKEKAAYGGRVLPAFQAYKRLRVQVRQSGTRMDVHLLDVDAPKRPSRDEDTVLAAFMVAATYKALYGDAAPVPTTVQVQYAGDTVEHVFPLPVKVDTTWKDGLPPDAGLAPLAKQVVRRNAP